MIHIANIAQVSSEIDTWLSSVKEETTKIAKDYAGFAVRWMALHSPQWSGDFAANWKVAIDDVDYSFTEDAVGGRAGPPRQIGHPQAVAHTTFPAAQMLARFKLGQTINITNSATHSWVKQSESKDGTKGYILFLEEHYAWKIEKETIKFRPENHEGGRVMGRLVEVMQTNYQTLTKSNLPSMNSAV